MRSARSWPIDLKAQSRYLDVLSIMPYHARFGHATDPAWISRQTASLGQSLGIKGEPGERIRIWPIVQLSDWGEAVPAVAGPRGARPWNPAPGHWGHGFRVGNLAPAMGQGRKDGRVLPGNPT